MGYGTHFTSINALRRRMAQSSESVSPGFIAMIYSVDESSRTVDCLVQNSTYFLRRVRYGTTQEDKPSYIKERSIVYIRRATGNKMSLEVEGPANRIPSLTAIPDKLPPLPTPPDTILTGLELVPSAFPGMTAAIRTGTARLNGSPHDFTICKVGESHSPKISIGTTPGVPKVGNLSLVGQTYAFIKVDAAPSTGSGQYRFDNVELGQDFLIDYRAGTASTTPVLQPVQSGHILLGTILVRPGVTKIFFYDINASISNTPVLSIPANTTLGLNSQVMLSLSLLATNGSPLVGSYVSISFLNTSFQSVPSPSAVYGSINPYPGTVTNIDGSASFTYNNTGATNSARILLRDQTSGAQGYVSVSNLDAANNPRPF